MSHSTLYYARYLFLLLLILAVVLLSLFNLRRDRYK